MLISGSSCSFLYLIALSTQFILSEQKAALKLGLDSSKSHFLMFCGSLQPAFPSIVMRSCPRLYRQTICNSLSKADKPSLIFWNKYRAQGHLGNHFGRSQGLRIRTPLSLTSASVLPNLVEDTAELNANVRLILLRSTLVESYDGEDKALQDIHDISTQFQAFVAAEPNWSLLSFDLTKEGKGGVYAVFKSELGADYDVEISLLGLDDYYRVRFVRDASAPNEPYMQLK